MKEFMNYNFNIDKIVVALLVTEKNSTSYHENRPSHGLAFMLGGNKVYTFSGGKKITVGEGEIIYLPKRSTYHVADGTKGNCYAINFDFPENITFPPFKVRCKNPNEFIKHFRTAANTWALKKNSYILKCKAELYSILYRMHEEYFSDYAPKNKLNIILPAVDYIHENYYTKPINIEEAAELCGVTSVYFRKIFKSFFGLSPITYINNLKMTRAKELLESGMYSVTDTAFQSGYTDISHFTRQFKKITGVSPSEYRKNRYTE